MIGTVVGAWKIEERLGEGGMGTVYAARHTVMGRRGAVKVLKQGLPLLAGEVIDCAVMNVAALRRFYAEQMAAAKADNNQSLRALGGV